MSHGMTLDNGRTLTKKHILAAFRDWRVGSDPDSSIGRYYRSILIPLKALCRRNLLLRFKLCPCRTCRITSHNLKNIRVFEWACTIDDRASLCCLRCCDVHVCLH
ncbi:hypothetical protein BDY19DRAFT_753990 [Irpex rosettiformis]|uniref:Uncharacterized protein n=1 Tax=Irpex rosettiformis TaxID=378272 RepID=A0ACB8U7C8_9APHY|nr:hypothetical protein BDY19DRAFT_753990 [Irpex rosettiformis]